ncbi:hypothetical protein AWY96_00220 [Serratia plymuthica]|uniref:hypothetical protein n=1 Tax=Serratia plymuthica TaxID=82996 RepID=UPI0007A008D7|nr:hypothetical protein [Serratia plymuthica]KYQ97007.1 hypothetical protein AWY96_00220 [Serratia plymuthica]
MEFVAAGQNVLLFGDLRPIALRPHLSRPWICKFGRRSVSVCHPAMRSKSDELSDIGVGLRSQLNEAKFKII